MEKLKKQCSSDFLENGSEKKTRVNVKKLILLVTKEDFNVYPKR